MLALMRRGSIMSTKDLEYYRERAVTERARAKEARRQDVAAIHEELARQYEALVDRQDLRPPLRMVFDDRQFPRGGVSFMKGTHKIADAVTKPVAAA